MPAPRMWGPDPGGVLPQAQATESAPPSLGGVPRLVQPAHLDGRPAPGAAPAGAVLPRVRRAVSARRSQAPHPGYGGGPHRPSPGGLGQVHRPGQPPELVQDLPRPQDGSGDGGGTAEKSWVILRPGWSELPGRLGAGVPGYARPGECGEAVGLDPSPRPWKVWGPSVYDRMAPLTRKIFPMGAQERT